MTTNIPGLGGQKPVDNNQPNSERRVSKVHETDGVRYFTAADGAQKIDRRKSPRRRHSQLDRRLLKAGLRGQTAGRRQGPRERRRAAIQRKKLAGNKLGRSVDRSI